MLNLVKLWLDVGMRTIRHRIDGISWVEIDIESLYSDGTIGFFIEGFSSYALAIVPEQGTYALLLPVLMGYRSAPQKAHRIDLHSRNSTYCY